MVMTRSKYWQPPTGPVVAPPVEQLPNLASVFGGDLSNEYTPETLFKDSGKTLAAAPGDDIIVWGDARGAIDLDVHLQEFFGNMVVPKPKVNVALLNGLPVSGSGNIYDFTTGAFITDNGDPTPNGVFNGFLQPGFDATLDTYCFFSVSKVRNDDIALFLLLNGAGDEIRALFGQDHHPNGSVLQNYVGANIQSYQGPGGNNAYHHDGTYRVICGVLSWTRAKNAIWVNGVKFAAGVGLPLQPNTDTGAGADLLVPTDPAALLNTVDAVPTAHLAVVKNLQADGKILAASRFLGQKYGIAVA